MVMLEPITTDHSSDDVTNNLSRQAYIHTNNIIVLEYNTAHNRSNRTLALLSIWR